MYFVERKVTCHMRIKYHYYLEAKEKILHFLNKYEIPYELSRFPQDNCSMCVFDLFEDQSCYEKFKQQFPLISRMNAEKYIEYSKEDIASAEWLTIRSKSKKVQWRYEETAFYKSCPYKRMFIKETYYRHIEQIGILSVDKSVKWGTRQFFAGPNTADDMLFCSKQAKEILGNNWKGLEFWPVRKCGGLNYFDDLYQLFFAETLPIETICGKKTVKCNVCGRKMICIPSGISKLKLDREYMKNSQNVYKTGEVLMENGLDKETFSVNIVSHDFYEYCEKRQMNRGMVYEPIELI